MSNENLPPFNPLRPLTRESLTDADIEFLNACRLGIIPFAEWSKERNEQLAYASAHDVMRVIHWNELSLDEKRLAVAKTFQLGFAIRMATKEAESKASASEVKASRIKIREKVDKKHKEKVSQAIASRDSQGKVKAKKVGVRGLDQFQRAVKALVEMNLGGKRVGMPLPVMISMLHANHPDKTPQEIEQTIFFIRRECMKCGGSAAVSTKGICRQCELSATADKIRPFQDESGFADIDREHKERAEAQDKENRL